MSRTPPRVFRCVTAGFALLALACSAPHASAWTLGGPAYEHTLARVWTNAGGVDVAWMFHGGGTQTFPWIKAVHTDYGDTNETEFGNYGFSAGALDASPIAASAMYVAAFTTTDSLGVHVVRVPTQAPFPVFGKRVSVGYTAAGGILSIRCATLSDGGCAVIWTRTVPSGTWINRVTATGALAPGWPAGGRKLGSLPWPDGIAVCDDGAGGLYAMFYDSDLSLYVTRYDATGTRVTNFPELLSSSALQNAPLPGLYTALSNRAITGWIDAPAPSLYNDGSMVEGLVTATGGFLNPANISVTGATSPTLVPTGTDGAYLVWAHTADGGATADLRAVLVLAGGTLASGWPATGLVLTPPEAVISPAVTSSAVTTGGLRHWNFEAASDGAGGLLVAWTDRRDGGSSVYLSGRRSNGTQHPAFPIARRVSPPGVVGSVAGLGGYGTAAPSGPVAYVAWDRKTGNPIPGFTDALELDAYAVNDYLQVGAPLAGGALALRAPSPNPASRAFTVHCALPSDASAELALFDVSGRRVESRVLRGAGEHTARFGDAAPLAPGVYHVRLKQAGAERTTRVAVVQ